MTKVRGIDGALVSRAVKLGKHKSKKEAVRRALEDYVQHLEQVRIIDVFGTIDFDPNYDYKAQRYR